MPGNHRILLIGGSGMLGAMTVQVLIEAGAGRVSATVRSARKVSVMRRLYPEAEWMIFRAGQALPRGDWDWIVNCAAVMHHRADFSRAEDRWQAVLVNAALPHHLCRDAERLGCKIFLPSTDAVYRGAPEDAPYFEDAPHEADTFYARSKSLGESPSPAAVNVRSALWGLEPSRDGRTLAEWLLRQPSGASLDAYCNQRLNGVTTLACARLIAAAVRAGLELPNQVNLCPADPILKGDLIRLVARSFRRNDLRFRDHRLPQDVDRTLATRYPEEQRKWWSAAGYHQPPTQQQMVEELAAYPFRAWQKL